MIRCENLTKIFNEKAGVHEVNLTFSPGTIYGIIGYNGAGKTTLLRCIEGLYLPTSGHVYHQDIRTTQDREFQAYRRNIAFLPTDEFLYQKLTCRENIELATILRTGKKTLLQETSELIQYLEVQTYLDKQFRACSTGMKKKIQIIISLIGEIAAIIWDEPNDGLDIMTNMKIKNLLQYYKAKHTTILLSCHVIEFLHNFIDYAILLQDGRVIEAEEAKNIPSLEALYLKHLDKDAVTFPCSK